MAMAKLTRHADDVIPHGQRQLLGSCYSLWTTGNNSPIKLTSRIGTTRSRLLLYRPEHNRPALLSHLQGHSGDTLVALNSAEQLANNFLNPWSLDAMRQHLSNEALKPGALQLYPNGAAIQLSRLQPISANQALPAASYANAFLPDTQPVLIEPLKMEVADHCVLVTVESDC